MFLLAGILAVFTIFGDNNRFFDAFGVTGSPAPSSWFRFIQNGKDECVSYAAPSEIKPDVRTGLIDEAVGVSSNQCGDDNIHLCRRESVTHFFSICQTALCPSHMDQMDCVIR